MTREFLEGELFPVLLFAGMLGMLELGRRYGNRRRRLLGEEHAAGTSAIEAAVFALLGLLVAFTFSGAAARFDLRRAQIVEEANDIGTAYLRLDLLPRDKQPELRQKFRDYVDARIALYQVVADREQSPKYMARANAIQSEIWTLAVPAAAEAGEPATLLMMPALNAMFDITNVRWWARQTHPPSLVFLLLGALAFASALVAGYGLASAPARIWLHMVVFALVLSITVFVIVDLEYPRVGFLRIDDFDRAIVDVRQSMK